jgi:ribonuclease HI
MIEKIYTDGSLMPKKRGGWAFVTAKRQCSGPIETRDTYDAELMAICQALEQADGPCCIVCDHVGIVQILRDLMTGGYDRPVKAPELWERIEDQVDKLAGIEWMKRMTTHEQRIADELAKKAAMR